MLLLFIVSSLAISSTALMVDDVKQCNANVAPIDFLVLKGDANAEAIEDEVRNDLEKIGIAVKSRFLPADDFYEARGKGDFGLSFSETWGAPYDPHSFVSAWEADNMANYYAFKNLEAPASFEELMVMIEDVLQEEDHLTRKAKWSKLHDYYHQQAVMLPLWGRRVIAIINSRLAGYEAGQQQFDFPVHRLIPVSGSDEVTISPGSQTGRFETIGNLDPHTYGANEFFANNWVYEGLVSYGVDGQILPSLAKTWTVRDFEGGSKYTFQLRESVLFHDGAPWNCQAAKMNLDHVLAGALREPAYHGWYGIPKYIKDWECTSDMELVMTTTTKFYPFLQELTFIRPIRFMSPNAFSEGSSSDPFTANSCERGWGTLESADGTKVVCTGISNITGTGPFAFKSRKSSVITRENDKIKTVKVDDEVLFEQNNGYWGGTPAIKKLKVVRYDTSNEIKEALLDGTLDVMWGDGVLPANDIAELDNLDDPNLSVFIGDDVQNVVLLFNTDTPPLDDIRVRKAIIHAIDKKRLIEKELGGFLDPVDNVFPRNFPYCDVDLTPHWDYDFEKAMLLSCNLDESKNVASTSVDSNNGLVWGIGIGLGALSLVLLGVAGVYVKKSQDLQAKLIKSESAVQA